MQFYFGKDFKQMNKYPFLITFAPTLEHLFFSSFNGFQPFRPYHPSPRHSNLCSLASSSHLPISVLPLQDRIRLFFSNQHSYASYPAGDISAISILEPEILNSH